MDAQKPIEYHEQMEWVVEQVEGQGLGCFEMRNIINIKIMKPGSKRKCPMHANSLRLGEYKRWGYVPTLKIGNNHHPTTFKELSPIRFPCLVKIIVEDNKIESVETLSQAFMPAMREFWISRLSVTQMTTESTKSKHSGRCAGLTWNSSPSVTVGETRWKPDQGCRHQYPNAQPDQVHVPRVCARWQRAFLWPQVHHEVGLQPWIPQ